MRSAAFSTAFCVAGRTALPFATKASAVSLSATSAGSESEEALASKGFTATIVPDASKKLYYVYKGASA